MSKGTNNVLLFSSFAAANVYKMESHYGDFDDGRIYYLKLCSDNSRYIGVCFDFYPDTRIQGKLESQLRSLCEQTYGGRFPGYDYLFPVDYLFGCIPGSGNGDALPPGKTTLMLVYPEYKMNDFIPVETRINRDNAADYMIAILNKVKKLHADGYSAGGFSKNSIVVDKKDNQLYLVVGANAVSCIDSQKGCEKYRIIDKIGELSKGFRREKLLGMPEKSCWEQLKPAEYAKCSDIYSVVTLGFMKIIGFHPMQGGLCDGMECDEVRQEVYQSKPVFIFDTDNPENHIGLWEDELEAIDKWNKLSSDLKKLYYQLYAFPAFDSQKTEQMVHTADCCQIDKWIEAFKKMKKRDWDKQ